MAVILEVKAGPFAGQRVAVMGGQTVTVGRTTRSNFAVPHDTFMSGVHFSVEDGTKGCILRDHKSSNGTFLNGARTTEALLQNGDEVRSGGTIFVVRMVQEETLHVPPRPRPQPAPPPPVPSAPAAKKPEYPAAYKPLPEPLPLGPVKRPPAPPAHAVPPAPAAPKPEPPAADKPRPGLVPLGSVKPRAAPPVTAAPDTKPRVPDITQPLPRRAGQPMLTIGGWRFFSLPEKWKAEGEYGIQVGQADGFPTSAVATEEKMNTDVSLQEYVEPQLAMLRQYLQNPQIDAIVPPKITGSEETLAVEVRFSTKGGQPMFYRRIYSRVGRTIGVLTFTALQNELESVKPAFDAICGGAEFVSPS